MDSNKFKSALMVIKHILHWAQREAHEQTLNPNFTWAKEKLNSVDNTNSQYF
jgi:hypothetical protein